jgi:hypothetical protein
MWYQVGQATKHLVLGIGSGKSKADGILFG